MMILRFKKSTYPLSIGIVAIVFGVALLTPALYFRWTNNGSVAAHGSPNVSKSINAPAGTPLITGDPVSIAIPTLNINLQVVNGYYNTKTKEWNLSLNQAQFATPSVEPNNIGGNTLIYGHYRPEVFAYLHLIKPGAQALITTDNGYIFTYTYTSTYATQPTDTSIFSNQGAPRLTVQTCSGAFFQNRQMYLFTYDGYQKISK